LHEKPWLATPYFGLLELQMAVLPFVVRAFEKRIGDHPVLVHLPGFLEHVRSRVYNQGKDLGFVPEQRPGTARRAFAMGSGLALFVRSQFARSKSRLEKIYIDELGLGDGPPKTPWVNGSGSSDQDIASA
jgi:hypothetical protein